ncbi:amidohydrolase family protein [Allosphingosinicella sp.]|uniref:amidohydrolase family protein n=1 Tax=Allosphingosinicella sp. TaxID=2823234 RepID=UPI002F011403
MRLILVFAALVLAGCAAKPERTSGSPEGQLLLLEHATLIDGSGTAPQPDRSILVSGDRIAAIYPSGSRPAPAGARVVDLSGRFVIPGLIDGHVHLKSRARDPGMMEQILGNVLRGGITTVRDMGGNGAELAPLARRANSLEIEAPHIVYATMLTGPASRFWMSGEPGTWVSAGHPPGTSPWFRRIGPASGPESAAADARGYGASAIKVHSGLNAAELAAVGSAARRHGLRLWTHAYVGPAVASDSVAAGASSISHADMLAYEGLGPRPGDFDSLPYIERTRRAMAATPIEGEALGRLFRLMRARSVCLESTLFVMTPQEPDPASTSYVGYAAAATARALRMGVPICAGTDAIGGSTSNLPAELELLVGRAGLTPLQAIRAATFENARALGLRDRGLVARGRRADLVVLTADPSRVIGNVRAVDSVYLGGRLVPSRPR